MKKVRVTEIKSKIKEIKQVKKETLEQQVEQEHVDLGEVRKVEAPVLKAKQPQVRELPQPNTSAPRPAGNSQPLYSESRQAYVSSSGERIYQDPMVASTRQAREKPSPVLKQEFMQAENDPLQTRSRNPLNPEQSQERRETYTVEQERARSDRRRRYPWEA